MSTTHSCTRHRLSCYWDKLELDVLDELLLEDDELDDEELLELDEDDVLEELLPEELDVLELEDDELLEEARRTTSQAGSFGLPNPTQNRLGKGKAGP